MSITFLLLVVALPAGAIEVKGLVAVLPFDVSKAKLDEASRATLEEDIRTVSGNYLSAAGYSVLTGENTLAVLAENDVDVAKACEASCALEAARELKATWFVSGSVASSEGEYVAFVRLYEAASGRQLGSVRMEGPTVRELRRQFEAKALELLKAVPGVVKGRSSGGAVAEGRIGGESGDFDVGGEDTVSVTFESTPDGAAVLVDGEMLCPQTPCTKRLAPGAHEATLTKVRYRSVQRAFDAKRGAVVSATLAPKFGVLDVTSATPELPISIDGTPQRTPARLELDAGGHRVFVDTRCFMEEGEVVDLEEGETHRVELKGNPRLGALRVEAVDGKGNDVDARVEVDGRDAGATFETIKLPVCSRSVTVRARGFVSWTRELALEEKQVRSLRADLKPGSDAKKGPTPPVAKGKLVPGTGMLSTPPVRLMVRGGITLGDLTRPSFGVLKFTGESPPGNPAWLGSGLSIRYLSMPGELDGRVLDARVARVQALSVPLELWVVPPGPNVAVSLGGEIIYVPDAPLVGLRTVAPPAEALGFSGSVFAGVGWVLPIGEWLRLGLEARYELVYGPLEGGLTLNAFTYF